MHVIQRILAALLLVVAAAGPAAAQSGSFGNSVAVGNDELIVAEPNNTFRSGVVYVYRKSGGAWQESAQLRAPDSERADGFGALVARAGNTLFVAQRGGQIHLFRRQGTGWQHAGLLPARGITGRDPGCSQYGYCGTDFGLTLAAAGDWLLVGEPGSAVGTPAEGGGGGRAAGEPSPAGTVHVFRRGANDAWTQQGTLRPSASAPGDGFGGAIAIEGGRALVGAPNHGAETDAEPRAGRVYEFALVDGAWRETGALESVAERNATFGSAIALAGDVAVIGAPGSGNAHGAAFVYRRDGQGSWIEQSRLAAFNSIAGDRFGTSVALAGSDVWVGAPAPRGNDMGTVYVFHGDPDAPLASDSRRIQLTETVNRDAFGDRIVAGSGVAAVTASGMHHQAGAVYVYERNAAGDWREADVLASEPDGLPALVGEERRCTEGEVGPFDCRDVELLAFIPNSMLRADGQSRGVRMNDNWGWTDPETGREYALVGRNDGTSFVDITDPVNPRLIGDLPKTPDTPPSQLWRDIKTYRDHAFIVADGAGNHGMQVFDLRRLRNVTDAPALFEPDAHYPNVASVHNIAINEETGYAFLVGSRGGGETCGGGLHMVDIRNMLNPVFAGCFRDESGGTHDVQCVNYHGPDQAYNGREICLKSNGDMFAISDVTDKDNPIALSRGTSPNAGYIHQGWLTDDHRYFIQDDEADVVNRSVPTTRTLVWDVSDLEDPQLVTEFMGSMPASAHNLYVKGDTAYQANYRYGLHILDITDPTAPRELGFFDTTPYLEGPGFSGAWSNYPFFESGSIVVTSLQEGLFILKKRDTTPVF